MCLEQAKELLSLNGSSFLSFKKECVIIETLDEEAARRNCVSFNFNIFFIMQSFERQERQKDGCCDASTSAVEFICKYGRSLSDRAGKSTICYYNSVISKAPL